MQDGINKAVAVLALAGQLTRAALAGDVAQASAGATNRYDWRVAEFALAAPNQVRCGTNTLSVTAFTNLADEVMGADVEAVLIHGGATSTSTLRVPPELLEYLLRTGKSILVDTREEASTPGDAAADENVRTISLKTSYLRIFDDEDDDAVGGSRGRVGRISLGSTFDVDTARGTYELREVGLGLWDDRLWLVRGLPAADADDGDTGSIGVQFKKEW